MKQIDKATSGDSEKGKKIPSSGSAGARTETDQVKLEKYDTRFTSPKSMKEAEVLEAALEMTRIHCMNLTGKFALSSPPFKGYMTQWQSVQDQLDAPWVIAGESGEPPNLFMLDPWTVDLGNWKKMTGKILRTDSRGFVSSYESEGSFKLAAQRLALKF